MTVFLPPREKATGAAVVIVPGGGHRELWPKHEGENVAEWLRDHGVAAVVLRYRLAREKGGGPTGSSDTTRWSGTSTLTASA